MEDTSAPCKGDISDTFPLEQAADAYQMMLEKKILKKGVILF